MSEVTHSILLADELRRAGLFFEHIENEGRRSARRGGIGKRMGRLAGSADYRIYTRPPKRPDVRFVALELKDDGESESEKGLQGQFLALVRAAGGEGAIRAGVDRGLAWLREEMGYDV